MIDVIIPHTAVNTCRDRNLFFAVKYLKKNLVNSRIIIAEQNTETDISEIINLVDIHLKIKTKQSLFCKSLLLNEGYNASKGKYLIFNDNDCIIDLQIIRNFDRILDMIRNHVILPYNKAVINLTESQTINLINNVGSFDYGSAGLNRRGCLSQGGVIMITSENYYKIGGHDPRFVGWGGEDDAFFLKANHLIGIKRTDNHLIHMNHPKISGNQNPNYRQNLIYYKEYLNKDNITNIVHNIGFDHLIKK